MALFYRHPVATVIALLLVCAVDVLLLHIGIPWWACWLVAALIGAVFGRWAARRDRLPPEGEG